MTQRPKRRRRLIVLAILVVVFGFLLTQWQAAIHRNRSIPDEPFQIAANLYSVGSTGVTAFLITGPEGHVLIDGGYPETAPLIIGSIAKLGFSIKDVKVLLNSHAHFDHAGGLRELQRASGAQLWISEPDAPIIESGGASDASSYGPLRWVHIGRFPAPRIDHRFSIDTTIRVGPLAVSAHITAGHTPGCTSWSFVVHHGDRDRLAVDVCSLTLLPFMKLSDPQRYPGIRSDFEKSFQTLRDLPADIFLASHGSFFDLAKKHREQVAAKDPVEPFIDRDGYRRFIDRAEASFDETLAKQRKQ
ncbi:MAG TPA: subclass B3 metallo-beta-lactamase [Gemmatimonadaceae bacterium]|jgi:metallo-beta-lactamase class B